MEQLRFSHSDTALFDALPSFESKEYAPHAEIHDEFSEEEQDVLYLEHSHAITQAGEMLRRNGFQPFNDYRDLSFVEDYVYRGIIKPV